MANNIDRLKFIEGWIIRAQEAMQDTEKDFDTVINELKSWLRRYGKPMKEGEKPFWKFKEDITDLLVLPYKDAKSHMLDAWREARKLLMHAPAELKADAEELSANLQSYGSLFQDDLSTIGGCRTKVEELTTFKQTTPMGHETVRPWETIREEVKGMISNLEAAKKRFQEDENYNFGLSLKLTMDLLEKFQAKKAKS